MAPLWICEVLSSSTERIDRSKKMGIHAREGVGYAWLVNPITRTLEVFRLAGGHWLLVAAHAREETVRAEPFDQIDLDLSALWSEPAGG